MLKRKNLEVLQDAPSCCSTRSESRNDGSQHETNISHTSSNNSNLLGPLDIEMDSTFDGLTGNEFQYSDLDQSLAHALSNTDDPFQGMETEMQSHAMMPEGTDQDFGSWVPPGGSAMDIAGSQACSNGPITTGPNHDPFDFHMMETIPNSMSYRRTQPGQHNSPRHNSMSNIREPSSGSTVEWSNSYDPGSIQHQQQSSSSASGNISSPVTPNMQTTIRLEGADPSTLSAVIGTLIESKARFRFETH